MSREAAQGAGWPSIRPSITVWPPELFSDWGPNHPQKARLFCWHLRTRGPPYQQLQVGDAPSRRDPGRRARFVRCDRTSRGAV